MRVTFGTNPTIAVHFMAKHCSKELNEMLEANSKQRHWCKEPKNLTLRAYCVARFAPHPFSMNDFCVIESPNRMICGRRAMLRSLLFLPSPTLDCLDHPIPTLFVSFRYSACSLKITREVVARSCIIMQCKTLRFKKRNTKITSE